VNREFIVYHLGIFLAKINEDNPEVLIPCPTKQYQRDVIKGLRKELDYISRWNNDVVLKVLYAPYFHDKRLWVRLRKGGA